MLPFKVAAKYARGPEQQVAEFDNQKDAKDYIQSKLESDVSLRVSVTYLLYDMGELVETCEPGSATQSDSGATSSGSSTGQQQSNSFRPSPLQTSPRPTGMPAPSFKDTIAKDSSDDKK